MLISKPGAASMMMRMRAQVSLVPPHTSHASNLERNHAMPDVDKQAKKRENSHSIASWNPVATCTSRGVAAAHTTIVYDRFAIGNA